MNNHPMKPPPEPIQELIHGQTLLSDDIRIAYAAGADAELEACCEWLKQQSLCFHRDLIPQLRAARRPKPPSLKQQALEAQQRMWNGGSTHADWELIRRALEALPDDLQEP